MIIPYFAILFKQMDGIYARRKIRVPAFTAQA